MGPSAGKETLTVLRRLIAYSGKVFHLKKRPIPNQMIAFRACLPTSCVIAVRQGETKVRQDFRWIWTSTRAIIEERLALLQSI